MPDPIKKVLKIMRIPLVIAIFYLIFRKLNFQDFKAALADTAWWTAPWIFLMSIAVLILQGVRMWVLLRAFNRHITFYKTLKYHLIGSFYSMVIPGAISQDIIRGMYLSRHIDYSVVWGATWVFKLLFVTLWLSFSAIGIVILDESIIPSTIKTGFFITVSVIFLCLFLSFFKTITRPVRKIIEGKLPRKAEDILLNIRQGIYEYRSKKKHLFYGVVATISLQLLIIFAIAVSLYGVTGKWYPRECLAFVPVIDTLSLTIALTPGAVGIREGLFAFMLTQIGISESKAASFVFINGASYLAKLVGGFWVLASSFSSTNDTYSLQDIKEKIGEERQ